MNKTVKFLSLALGATFAGVALVGCKPTVKTRPSTKAKQINVSMYEGGYGTDWIKTLAKEFNETTLKETEYEIVVIPEKRLADSIITECSGSNPTNQLFINAGNELKKGIELGYFTDLSDILTSEVDGEGNGTIQEKIAYWDVWSDLYSKSGTGLFALPYSVGFHGFVIDHKEFIDQEWYNFATATADGAALEEQGITYAEEGGKLKFVSATGTVNYKAGDLILTKGKDGKFGTYDDGQPTTLAEFDDLVNRIGENVFIWGGGVAEYLNAIFDAIFAQYEGMEDYDVYYNYDSKGREIEFFDGTKEVVTLETGYKTRKMEGVKVAYEFFEKYFDYMNPDNAHLVHPTAKNTSASQFDGQNKYLLGYQNTSKNPQSAMLVEGTWWENEATAMFNELDSRNRGKGDREYRYLLLPDFEGQANDKTCFSVTATGSICMSKDKDKTREAYTKDFIRYILRDESLRFITRTTGDIVGYHYEMTEADKSLMTPFQKNCWELYYDKENIEIVSRKLYGIQNPLSYATDLGFQHYYLPVISGAWAMNTIDASKSNDLNDILDGCKNAYSATTWANLIKKAKDQGFFREN
jgi:hypothetical protein